MSDSKAESEEHFLEPRSPLAQSVQNENETASSSTGNIYSEKNVSKTDTEQESFKTIIKNVTEWHEKLERFAERSAHRLEEEESAIAVLLDLLGTYKEGLQHLLNGPKCSQINLKFIETLKSNELVKKEYQMLDELFEKHINYCNFQLALDLGDRLLEIACDIRDTKMIIETLAKLGLSYLLLGSLKLSYYIMTKMTSFEMKDLYTRNRVIGNLSVVELLLGYKQESLKHAKDSLDLAQKTGVAEQIACAHGNIGLAYENMGMFHEAIEPYEKCLQIGKKTKNHRVINNGFCNLGRAYQGLKDIQTAKEYFQAAIKTPPPSKAHWGDTKDFRFSGDYLLAKLAMEEKNWDKARKYLKEVINRCESLRKSIFDSPVKITFNETQCKPFQYLQHVLLEERKKIEALVVAEKERGRDFFDKVESKFCTPFDSEDVLLEMIKKRGVAVLFISSLREQKKLCFWFISSDGKLKHWSIPNTECDNTFTKLCAALFHTHGRHEIEFKGTTEKINPLIKKAFELLKINTPGNFDSVEREQPCGRSSKVDSTAENITNIKWSSSTSTTNASSRAQKTAENRSLSDVIDQLSKLILSPLLQQELEELINKPTTDDTPRLLIIPQGQTFNIPFAALKLNEKPLCNHLTIIEAISFNSFDYTTAMSEKTTTDVFENALVVGNPTQDLPRAEQEAQIIAKCLGVTPLIRDEATKIAVMKQIPAARLIHFACHGEMGGKALILASANHTSYKDSHLTTEDVESLKLNADLVVLSACHTARGKISSEGVLGLARAFLVAGARTVVTALWAIPDNATKYFMEHFYENLRSGQPVADAIRATQMTMQESQNFQEVMNWGSFKVFGANARITWSGTN